MLTLPSFPSAPTQCFLLAVPPTVMAITTRPQNVNKRLGLIDAPAHRRTHAEVQAAKKKKALEKKKAKKTKANAQKDLNRLEHDMAVAESQRRQDHSKERPPADVLGDASRPRSRPHSPSSSNRLSSANMKKAPSNDKKRRKGPSAEEPCTPVPSRPASSHSRDAQSASSGVNEEPPKAPEKKSLVNDKRRRKGLSTDQSSTPVPGHFPSSQSRDTDSALNGDNEIFSDSSRDLEGETISAKRRKLVQSKTSRPLHLDNISAPVTKRGKSDAAGRRVSHVSYF